jgi:hypothetical protein
MIARHETLMDKTNLWAALAAPLPIIELGTVLARLDECFVGEWDVTHEVLPPESDTSRYAFKARLQILGVIRESVGTGTTYKRAAASAFLNAAAMFRIGAGDPIEQTQDTTTETPSAPVMARESDVPKRAEQPVACPKCSGPTWDNRATKRNPKAPDYKCRNRACDGAVWPPKGANADDFDMVGAA